jgi:hypothetical protein
LPVLLQVLPYCTLMHQFLRLRGPAGLLNVHWLFVEISCFARAYKPVPTPCGHIIIGTWVDPAWDSPARIPDAHCFPTFFYVVPNHDFLPLFPSASGETVAGLVSLRPRFEKSMALLG